MEQPPGCKRPSKGKEVCSTVSDSLWPHSRFLCPWDFPGKNTGVGYHSLLQGIFLIQGWKLSLWHFLRWQTDSLPQSYVGSSKEDAEDTTVPRPRGSPDQRQFLWEGNTLQDPAFCIFVCPYFGAPATCQLPNLVLRTQRQGKQQGKRQ